MLKEFIQKLRGSQMVELPGYVALGMIRQGSMSVLFKARQQDTDRLVAVKVYKPSARKAIERLETHYRDFTEGEITAAFDHSNVVKCFGHGELGGAPYLILEYLEGMTLSDLTRTESKRLEGRRLSFIRQAAAALAHVHARRFVHHDFSPKNLFVTQDNQIKLLDFGLATPLLELPTIGSRMGTAEILPPELLRREPSDQRVDVYAWGVVAYEVLTGHWPFESSEHHQTYSKILNVRPIPVAQRVPPVVPEEVTSLVMRCLEKNPAKRLCCMNVAAGILDRHTSIAF